MSADDPGFDLELSRRRLLAAAGLAGSSAIGAFSAPTVADAVQAPALRADVPSVAGLHLQFGADAAAEIVASWHTLEPVGRPRVLVGRLSGSLHRIVAAETVSYVDAKSNKTVYAHHASIGGLLADTAYLYAASHDGAEPLFSTFRTAPRGRAAFTFTSFGDQGTPTLGRELAPQAGAADLRPVFVNDNLGSPAAAETTLGGRTGSTAVSPL